MTNPFAIKKKSKNGAHDPKILKLIDEGLSDTQIADKLKMDRRTIVKIVRRLMKAK